MGKRFQQKPTVVIDPAKGDILKQFDASGAECAVVVSDYIGGTIASKLAVDVRSKITESGRTDIACFLNSCFVIGKEVKRDADNG